MKKTLQQTLAPIFIGGCIIASSVSVSAMDNTAFKNALIQEIQMEEGFLIADSDMEMLLEELEDVSQDEIIKSLKEEISLLEEEKFQEKMENEYKKLISIKDETVFIKSLNVIYGTLDQHYVENGGMSFGEAISMDEVGNEQGIAHAEVFGEFDFASEKQLLLEDLKDEISYLDDEVLKKEMNSQFSKLSNIDGEDDFFESLDNIYASLDDHYGFTMDEDMLITEGEVMNMEEYSFDEIKGEILESLDAEKQYITDKDLEIKFMNVVSELENETNEDSFFDKLDALYEDEELNEYYMTEGVEMVEGDDFFGENFDFEAEKQWILKSLTQEINNLEDAKIRAEATASMKELEKLTDSEDFFEFLGNTYDIIDGAYEDELGGMQIIEIGDENLLDFEENQGELFEISEEEYQEMMKDAEEVYGDNDFR